ncbi:Glutamate receptor ionotropic kainate 3 [Taenia solium]
MAFFGIKGYKNVRPGNTDYVRELVFLIRLLKNVFFSTIYLPSEWKNNDTIKDVLIKQFQNTDVPQTYVLLFKNEHSDSYTNDFLELKDSCSVYKRYLRTGAWLITFGLSTAYAPETPAPFYDLAWRASATYLDGLTYITEDATQVVGSWVLNREPQLVVDSINSTLTGRTIKAGIVKYTPFYDNGTGFSIPVMEILAFLAKINYEVVLFEQKSNESYYAEMLKAIVNHEIDVGFTPVPLSTINTEKVSSSSATLTISFTLVRQRPSRPADFLLLLRPLSLPVWLASVVLAFIFTGLLMAFGHLKPVIMRNLAEGEMTSKRDLFEVSALGVASTFSLTKLQIIPTTLSSRIFALLMWMFSYLLIVFYASAMMTILLRIRKPSNTGITVDEVLNANSHLTLIVIKNGIGYDSIIGSLNNNSKSYTSLDSIQAAYDALMKDDKTVLLASSIEASYISVMNCALEMVLYTRMYKIILSFPYYKPWTFGPQLDYYFSIISNSGTLTSSASVYFETGRCYQPTYNVPTPSVLELGDSASIYIFLLIGIIVSFIIMGLELLVKHIVGEREAKELTLLVPGRQYTAKIISIKRNGVNVNVADRPEVVFIPNSQLHTDPLKVYNALDMGLAEGDSIEVTYFGKASDGVTELFCRHFPND